MAVRATETDTRVERMLSRVAEAWFRVPRIRETWDAMDYEERLVFLLEWPMKESDWIELTECAQAGQLSEEQQVRYTDLAALIQVLQPIIEELYERGPV